MTNPKLDARMILSYKTQYEARINTSLCLTTAHDISNILLQHYYFLCRLKTLSEIYDVNWSKILVLCLLIRFVLQHNTQYSRVLLFCNRKEWTYQSLNYGSEKHSCKRRMCCYITYSPTKIGPLRPILKKQIFKIRITILSFRKQRYKKSLFYF